MVDIITINPKEILIELLKDNDIKEIISKIAYKTETKTDLLEIELEKLKNENKKLINDNENLLKNIKNLEEQLQTLENEKEEAIKNKNEIWHKNENLNKEIEPIKDLLEIWHKLNNIDNTHKEFLDKLNYNRNIYAYMLPGQNLSKVEQLYNYIKDIAVSDTDKESIEILSKYLDYCIHLYNLSNTNEKELKIIEVKMGENFNSEKFIKTSKSKLNGLVTKVLVNGRVDSNDKIKFKPIVKTQ